ncbi:MAG: hypothetical protein V1839_03400 [archaeon]
METAKTLKNLLGNPVVQTSLDRTMPIEGTVRKIADDWSADLLARKPAPAYRECAEGYPIYQGTDLDLFTVMNALAQREAIINIPRYDSMTATKLRDDQRVVSKQNRHGQVLGTVSNAKVHSFSTKLKDYNVVQTDPEGRESVGAFRNFALVGQDGQMYSGWHTIEFKATPEEKEFFEDRKLYTVPGTITVHNFVHPNLAMAFLGSRYLATKALSARISEESKFYRDLAGILRDSGVNLGFSEKPEAAKAFLAEDQELEKVTVEALEAKLVLPEATGEYPIYGTDKNGKVKQYSSVPGNYVAKQGILRFAENRAKELSYSIGPKVNAPVRAVELAFYLDGFKGVRAYGNEKEPSWGTPDWIRGYKEGPRTRVEWNAMKFGPQVALLYRVKETTATVKA